MRILILLLVLVLAAWALPAQAQTLPRVIQCEDCTPPQMRGTAARRQNPGAIYVFSLKKGLMLRYWVEYDSRDSMRWIATPIEPEAAALDMFAHMLNAYELKSNIFVAQQVFRGSIDVIGGGPHNPVAVSLNGEHDSAYRSFINYARSCLASKACTVKINPALAELNLAEKKARSLSLSLFRGVTGGFAWQDVPPRVTVRLCDNNRDCAILKYENGEWVYVETVAEGGNGKRYPKYQEELNYNFANSGEAGVFERGLDGGGASIFGDWKIDAVLACTSVAGRTTCEYYYVPR